MGRTFEKEGKQLTGMAEICKYYAEERFRQGNGFEVEVLLGGAQDFERAAKGLEEAAVLLGIVDDTQGEFRVDRPMLLRKLIDKYPYRMEGIFHCDKNGENGKRLEKFADDLPRLVENRSPPYTLRSMRPFSRNQRLIFSALFEAEEDIGCPTFTSLFEVFSHYIQKCRHPRWGYV